MLFKNTGKKVLVHQQQKQKVIVINTNIWEHFWRIQQKMRGLSTSKTHILLKPFGPIPLELAHPDGSRRTTTKSQLMDEILTYCNDILKPEEFYKSQEKPTAYLVDLTLSDLRGREWG